MRTVLRVVQGVDDDVEETDPYVSTGQAAEILGDSARTVARHLDAGDIPCELRGKDHRRARLSDIPAYKEKRSARATELARMREAAADGNLYDLDLSDQCSPASSTLHSVVADSVADVVADFSSAPLLPRASRTPSFTSTGYLAASRFRPSTQDPPGTLGVTPWRPNPYELQPPLHPGILTRASRRDGTHTSVCRVPLARYRSRRRPK